MTKTMKRSAASEVPVLEVDPFDEETIRNPYEFHRLLREAGPVAYIPKHDMYAVGRYDSVKAVIADYERFTSAGGIGLTDIRKPDAWRAASPISEVDPPHHTDVRAAMTKILSPLVIRQWREVFTAEADKVAERAVAQGELDAVRDIVEAFILKAFPDVLGVDMPREHFLLIGEMNFNQMGPQNEILARSMKKVEPILDDYAKAFERESVISGGFAERIFEAEDAGDFAPGTGGTQVRSFLRAGVDTTIAGVGHTLRLLAENPAEWEKLRDNPKKTTQAFDEGIRLESPAQVIFRTAVGEPELDGYRLAPDTKVGMFLGAANRDERQFPEPERYDIDRDSAGIHVALGAGHHICIGQMVARLEAECILGALLRHADRLELAGEPEIRPVNTLRTLERLPLRVAPAA